MRRIVERPRVELQFVNDGDELFAIHTSGRRLVSSRLHAIALVHSIDGHYWGLDLQVFPPGEPERVVFLDATHFRTVCRPFCIPKLACFAAWNGLRMEQGNLLPAGTSCNKSRSANASSRQRITSLMMTKVRWVRRDGSITGNTKKKRPRPSIGKFTAPRNGAQSFGSGK